MPRPRKRWRHSEGRRGETVALYEPRVGSDLRWDYQDAEGQRRRPWADPPLRVRHGPDQPVDAMLEREAIEECRRKYHEIRGRAARERRTAIDLTVADAFALYHDPRDGGMPKSRSARTHHTASREFWTERLGRDTRWNDWTPNITEAALKEIIADGMVPTARKRHQNARTVYNWLRTKLRMRGLEDPTLGVDIGELTAGYEPRRPRYQPGEVKKLVRTAVERGGRLDPFTAIMADHGPRAIQVRHTWRSGLDMELEDPPTSEVAPHGWMVLPGVKKQSAMLILLTKRAREAIDRALAGYLADWEAEYQRGELEDYPLFPGGRIDRDEMEMAPISDTMLRREWTALEKAAGVPTKPRRAFHALRRAWAARIEEEAGMDTLTHAGNWSSPDTPRIYVPPRRLHHLERAREIMEQEASDGE